MKDKKKLYLILTLLLCLVPTIVLADDGTVPLSLAYFWCAFCSIHWHLMAMMPLAEIRKAKNPNANPWTYSIIRAVILLFILPFQPMLFIVDFIALFVVVFVALGSGVKNGTVIKKGNNYTVLTPATNVCKNCGMVLLPEDKFCGSCGAPKDGSLSNASLGTVRLPADASLGTVTIPGKKPFTYNVKYKSGTSVVVNSMILDELKKSGADLTMMTPQAKKRKMITTILFALITFMMVSLIFFHLPFQYYLIEVVALVFYLIDISKGGIAKELFKEVKARPDEKISNIVASKVAQLETATPKITYLGLIAAAAFIPLIIFSSPKIFYEEYNEGYRVRFYAFGLNNMNSVTIPERHNGKAVIALRGNAFSNMPLLTKVTLPNTIKEINGQAFKNDINLTSVKLPSGLTYLGGSSFANCTSLESIVIPDGIVVLEGGMFQNCISLTSVKLPENMQAIHGETFMGCTSLERIELPSKISEIRGDTFSGCSSLDNVNIPDGVVRIGGHAFEGCRSLSNITIPKSVDEIGSSAFRDCYSLREVKISSMARVADNSFKNSPTTIDYYDF